MNKPFKFRYVNEIAGVFVMVAVVAMIAGLVFVARGRHWFEPVRVLELEFIEENTYGLQIGGLVEIMGTTVGSCRDIKIQDAGGMRAIITVRGPFMRFVRMDSKAIARKKFGVAGDTYIEITRGVGEPLPDGVPLKCVQDTEITQTIQQVLDQLREAILPMVDQVNRAVTQYADLGEKLNAPDGDVQKSLSHLRQLLEGLERGEGTAGAILRDQKMADEISQLVKDARRTTGNVAEGTHDLPALILQLQQTLRQTEALLTQLQGSWLLGGGNPDGAPASRIEPARVGGAR